MRRIALLFAVFGLGACAAPLMAPRAPAVTLTPDANGLAVAPSGLRIDFDRSPEGVIAVLDRVRGRHAVLSLARCPDDMRQQLRWGDLVLTFSDEGFVGWRQDGRMAGRVCGL